MSALPKIRASESKALLASLEAPRAPTYYHGITIGKTTYRIWTWEDRFHHENYFTVLAALNDLEREEIATPPALVYLEHLVYEYLLSQDSKEDGEKMGLLMNPDRKTINERLYRNLETLLEERKDEYAARALAVYFRMWKKGLAIDERARRSALREQYDNTYTPIARRE